MKTNEIREKYLDFFKDKGHTIVPSDVLVPKWDPTVLFTPAGMNQFKDHFLGNVELQYTRATTCQKCLRTGDIDNVGRTAYHHTFFEMLGNFSFGDYFKRDAIHWAWSFLTDKKWMGIDPDRLSVTVYREDDEAGDIWQKEIGLAADRISREDEDENFWPAEAPSKGPDGVCGPCSEIYFTPDDGNVVEIWNLVFTQFDRKGDPPNNLHPLPNKNIDTGMGLERIAATMQGVETNYHIDSLRPLVEAAGEICDCKYDPQSDQGRRLRRIADHVRACTFSIHENTNPGPKAEQSVIRTLARRAFLDGYQMGQQDAFLFKLVPKVVELMKSSYPDLVETIDRVQNTLKAEESSFLHVVESGIARVEPLIAKAVDSGQTVFSGEHLFELHTSHGVPIELTEKLAMDAGLTPDRESYLKLMHGHESKSGTDEVGVMGGGGALESIKNETKSTTFVGYDSTSADSKVVGLVKSGAEKNAALTRVQKLACEDESPVSGIIVLEQSPFYAESGGQVGDTGTIETPSGKFRVDDTQKNGDMIQHLGELISGTISEGENATAHVDHQRRNAIRRAHSATHILHYSLQKHLGRHAQQQGSKVEADLLRFDYSNPSGVDDQQLLEIEATANQRVQSGEPIAAQVVALEEARQAGAMMLFGEKYPDPCRMVSMGEFSKELCGGTHLENTAEIGLMEIENDSKLAAGVRRIQVLTGDRAQQHRTRIQENAQQAAELLGCSIPQLPQAIGALTGYAKKLKKQLDAGKSEIPTFDAVVGKSEPTEFVETRNALRESARILHTDMFSVVSRIESTQSEIEKLKTQLEKLESSGGVSADDLIESASECNGVKLIAAELPGGNPNLMRGVIDKIRKSTSPVCVMLASAMGESKVLLVAGISRELVDRGLSAGNWVKEIAPIVGGGGGGKPDMAQAGGKDPSKIAEALAAAPEVMQKVLESIAND